VSAARAPLAVGFPPIAAANSRVLVLGSLPGRRSLEESRYYAQPQNAFWRIMGRLFGAAAELPYDERLARLHAHGVAVWDVVAAAERDGSLDSRIVAASIVVNDFAAFFARHSGIELVCFNGNTASELYRRRVLPTLSPALAELPTRVLPSTSPAYAALTFEQKLARWSAVLGA
jgi:hypoxanthine-DNA glycosylase